MKHLPIIPEVQALLDKWKELDRERTKIGDRRKKDYKAVEVQQNKVIEEIEKLVATQAKEILTQEGFIFDEENKYITAGGCVIFVRPHVSIWSMDFWVGYDLSLSRHEARFGNNSLFKSDDDTIKYVIEKADKDYVERKKVENKNATNSSEFYKEVKEDVTNKSWGYRDDKSKDWSGDYLTMEFNNPKDKWCSPSMEVKFYGEIFNIRMNNCIFEVDNKEDALKIWEGFKKFTSECTDYTKKKGGI